MPRLHNLKHEAFCRTYVCDKDAKLNATRSYMKSYPKASYRTALVNGPVLLGKTRTRVAELMEEEGLGGENVAHSLKQLMSAVKPVVWQGRVVDYRPDNEIRMRAIQTVLKVLVDMR